MLKRFFQFQRLRFLQSHLFGPGGCNKANMLELKQTKSSDRSTVGRVWVSEFEGYWFDSRNRQIFDTSENSKIYFSNDFS